MPDKQFEWLGRIKDVDREYVIARLALSQFNSTVIEDPTVLQGAPDIKPGHVPHTLKNLEATYFIRLFAEAEAALRDYWLSQKQTEPPAQQLLNGIAARRQIPHDLLRDAHEVRECRNDLVHGPTISTVGLSISNARRRLCKYIARLPPTW